MVNGEFAMLVNDPLRNKCIQKAFCGRLFCDHIQAVKVRIFINKRSAN